MRPARVKQGDSLTVLAACFAQRPERAWFTALEAHNAAFSLIYVESRVTLVRRARSLRPCVVLLPVHDACGIPSAPLITRLREHAPNVRVMVLLTPGSSRAGLAEAICAGGEALAAGSEQELLAGLHDTRELGPLSVREHDATRALLADIRPVELRELLQFCAMHAHRRLSVANVAAERGVSSRKLGRETRASSWPTSSESIEWGRLLRASMLQWRESSSLATLARASGFASVRGLQHSAARLLHRSAECAGDLSPFLVSTLLNRRVQQIRRAAKA